MITQTKSLLPLPIYERTTRQCSEPFLSISNQAKQIPHIKSRAVRHWMASKSLAQMISALRGE